MYRRLLQSVSRGFSSPIPAFVSSLQKEMAYEAQRYTVSEEIQVYVRQTYLKRTGLVVKEGDESTDVTLSKDVGNSLLEITFQARTNLPEPEQGEGSEESREAERNLNSLSFQVAVTMAGKGLVFECLAEYNEMFVNGVHYTDDVSKCERQSSEFTPEYRGPNFDHRDSPFKESASKYLEFYGVDTSLISFLKTYATDKEQRLYQKWLRDVNGFFTKS